VGWHEDPEKEKVMSDTPLLDELEKGPWPSFVKEIKMAAAKNAMAKDLLGVLEKSYRDKIGYWKHGGIVGVMGYVSIPEQFPHVAHFHTLRINQPAGWYYTTKALRGMCEMWDRLGSGLTNMHGSTGDIILLGTTTEQLEPIFDELQGLGFDIGGSGSDVRTPSCCLGKSRCEWACYDTQETCYKITMRYQDELHRPAFPYKYKFKFSGCANDCVASVARADMSFIGTWRDDIKQDDAMVAEYAKTVDIQRDVVGRCPSRCMSWDGATLSIDNDNCVHCMHCINVMPKALSPGDDRGCTVLLGSKAPIVEGAMLSSVLIPFLKIDDEEDFDALCEIVEEIWDLWCEDGKNRERVGEFIERVGKGNFLEAIGLEPIPEMVEYPRDNPYIFYEQKEEE